MNTSRIVLGLVLIVGATGAIAAGATGAFFSDTETSTGNTFTAGSIDLKIDNESYYNGNVCRDSGTGDFRWQGTAAFPVPGTPCDTSFPLSDLDAGKLFFNFSDIKPDDEGEDTISIHVQNNAYACMDLTLTSDDDKSSTDPELGDGDTQENVNDTWDGELADNLQFFWWADDGDNVYEAGENAISKGVQTLTDLATTTGSFSVTLADSTGNVWASTTPAIPANQTVYIAKAWCFGTLTNSSPVAQDGLGHTGTNGPQVRGTGVQCDGSALNNITQTDGATLDVQFRAVQARNNPNFRCGDDRRTATLTIIKVVTNDNGGNNIVADFQLFADNGVTSFGMTSGVSNNLLPGAYSVTETGVSGYVASFSGDCDSEGNVTLNTGDNKTCTITNNDLPANITLIKNVTGAAPLADPSTFKLRVDGTLVPNTTSIAVTSNANHFITEDPKAGYHFVSITGAGCPAATTTPIVLNEGQALTCTINNAKNL